MKAHFGFNSWSYIFLAVELSLSAKCLEALHLAWTNPTVTQIRNLRSKIIAICFYGPYHVKAPPLACRRNILVLRSENPLTVGQSLCQALAQEMSDTTIVLDVEYIYHDEVRLFYSKLVDRILRSEDLQLILLAPGFANLNIYNIKSHINLFIITGDLSPWRQQAFIEFSNTSSQLICSVPEKRSLLACNNLHSIINTSGWF